MVLYWHRCFPEEPLTSVEPFHRTKGSFGDIKIVSSMASLRKILLEPFESTTECLLWHDAARCQCKLKTLLPCQPVQCAQYYCRYTKKGVLKFIIFFF